MPTRRQLLHGGAGSVAGVGAAAVLASCTPPPPAVAPQALRDALPHAQRLPPRPDASATRTAHGSKNILHERLRPRRLVSGRPSICASPAGPATTARAPGRCGCAASDGSLLHPITNPAVGVADLDPCVGPDGQTIVFSRDTHRLRLRRRASGSCRPTGRGCIRCPGGAGGISPSFSPDSKFIVYAAPDGIRRIPTAGGTPTLLARGRLRAGSSPSRPGRWPATGSRSSAATRRRLRRSATSTGTGGTASVLHVHARQRSSARPGAATAHAALRASTAARLRGPRRDRRLPAGDRRAAGAGSSVRSGPRRPTCRPCPESAASFVPRR